MALHIAGLSSYFPNQISMTAAIEKSALRFIKNELVEFIFSSLSNL